MPRQEQRRLSVVLAAFVAAVSKLEGKVVKAVATAVRDALGTADKATRRVLKGQEFFDREVNTAKLQGALSEALPRDWQSDVRDVVNAVAGESAKRGEIWARQCLAGALEELVCVPLEKKKAAA
jgi:hypothetical protein